MNIKKILSNTILKDLYLLLTAPIDSPVKKSINGKKAEDKSEDRFIRYILDNLVVGKMKGGRYVARTTS
ncbi:hypothetical protein HYS96_02680 [Candidatus Daviesbacteria bacterium]|nr:hypothetical protein [Candidatus Daviesbacteria bacterium]